MKNRINFDTISSYLGMPEEQNDTVNYSVNYTSEGGPDSQLDAWLYFIEGQLDSWMHVDAKNNKKSEIKIIVCDFLIKSININSHEYLLFWTVILSKYGVYIWNGKSIFENTPVHSLNEFLSKKETIVPATSVEVMKALAEQGDTPDSYCILDAKNLRQVYSNLGYDGQYATYLPIDLRFYTSIEDRIQKVVQGATSDAELYFEMDHESVGYINKLVKMFPKAVFNFKDISFDTIKTLNLPGHEHSTIHFRILTTIYPIFNLPHPIKVLNLLTLGGSHSIKIKRVEELNIEEKRLQEIIVEESEHLLSLKIPEPIKTSLQFKGGLNKLVNLKLKGTEVAKVLPLLKGNNSLKEIHIDAYQGGTISLPSCTTLEQAFFTQCADITKIEAKSLENFKTISIKQSSPCLEMLSNLPRLEKLTLCEPIDVAIDDIYTALKNVSVVKNIKLNSPTLKVLHLINLELTDINSINCPNLEELILEGVRGFAHINVLPNFPKLKSLCIKNCGNDLTSINAADTNIEEIKIEMPYCTFIEANLDNCTQLKSLYLENSYFGNFSAKNCNKLTNYAGMLLPQSLMSSNCKRKLIGDMDSIVYLITAALKATGQVSDGLKRQLENSFKYTTRAHLQPITYKIYEKLSELFPQVDIKILTLSTNRLTAEQFDQMPLDVSRVVTLEAYQDDSELADLTKFKNAKFIRFINTSKKLNHIYCPDSVEYLEIQSANLVELDLSNCHKLTCLRLVNLKQLQKIILPTDCRSLQTVIIYGAVNLAFKYKLPNIKYLHINDAKQAEIDASGSPVEVMYVEKAAYAAINIKDALSLRYFYFVANKGSIANLKNTVNLRLLATTGDYAKIYKDEINKNCTIKIVDNSQQTNDVSLQNNLMLDRVNSKRQISIFSYTNSLAADGATEGGSTYSAKGGFSFIVLNDKSEVQNAHYLIQTLNQLVFKNGNLIFTRNDASLQPTKVMIKTDKNKNTLTSWLSEKEKNTHAVMKFKGKVTPGVWYPLPTEELILDDDNLEVLSQKKISIYKNNETLQYHFRLDQGKVPQDLELFYRAKRNSAFKDLPLSSPFVTNQPILDADAHQFYMEKVLSLPKEHPLPQIFNLQSNTKAFLDALIAYCKAFKDIKLTKVPVIPAEILWQEIIEQRGACRHRSEAFFLLARMGGIPVNIIVNHIHAFPAIPYIENGKMSFHYTDLGGAVTYDITPASTYDAAIQDLKELPKAQLKLPQESEVVVEALSEEEQEWYDKYYQLFSKILAEDILTDFNKLFNDQESLQQPLLEVKSDNDAMSVTANLIAHLRKNNAPYVYIDSPKDFNLFLKPNHFENGAIIEFVGPLAKILKEGGTLIINWNNFSPAQVASYKSILDQKPTLMQEEVSKQVKVIGIIKNDNVLVADALSRCKKWQVDNTLLKSSTIEPIVSDIKPIEVDLFESSKWREKLLGQIKMQGKERQLIEQSLMEAIRLKRPLMIYNPPKNDRDFDLLMFRIKNESRFLYNGEMIEVPVDFKVILDLKKHERTLPNVKILDTTEGKNKIYIGLHNLHLLTDNLIIDNQTKSASVSDHGLLDIYDIDKDCFYITQSIPTSEWENMLQKIQERYSHKQFNFSLAPSVKITDAGANTAASKPTEVAVQDNLTEHNFIISNDPDYVSQQIHSQLKTKNQCHLIEIGDKTTSKEILFKIDNDKEGFQLLESKILQLLKGGETVILNGDISASLYQQILPLLDNPPVIYYNGQKHITGRLFCVTANNTLKFKPFNAAKVSYTFDDYLAMYPKEDANLLLKIKQFRDLLSKLPHQGHGRPEPFLLSYHRLSRFLDKLKNGSLHPHNPIKGLLLYDYPYKSNDYHYLNVIAKYLFNSEMKDALSKEQEDAKLLNLLKNNKISSKGDIKEHIWKILNCFGGKTLNLILGENLRALNFTHDFPQVNDELLEQMMTYITKLSPTQFNKESTADKALRGLKTLLNEQNSPLIILKGPPGSGKSFTVRKMKDELNATIYDGKAHIRDFLKAKGTGNQVLLLDEGNMATPGTWDFLRGIRNNTVYFEGEQYPLNPNQKIVVTCNPENFPGRHYHSFFQNYGETLYFKSMNDNALAILFLLPILGKKYAQYVPQLLEAYNLIGKYQPNFSYSIRDLENLVHRFMFLLEYCSYKAEEALINACVGEFAGMISIPNQRESFIQDLGNRWNLKIAKADYDNPTLVHLENNKLSMSSTKMYLYEAIKQDLAIRNVMSANPKCAGHYKQCLLIEGDIGLGKSTILRKILKANGFTKDAIDTSKRFYQITAGTKDVHELLIKAYYEGSVVILDEFNIDGTLEDLLNQLLSDSPQFGPPKVPGFMVLATQNPSTIKGREPVSMALRNRVHFIYMDKNTSKEEIIIAANEMKPIPHPRMFAMAFNDTKTKDRNASARTYWVGLHKTRQEYKAFATVPMVVERPELATMEQPAERRGSKHSIERKERKGRSKK